jgi:hypothetical protein
MCYGKIGTNGEVVAVLFESNSNMGVTNGMFAHAKISASDLKGPMQGRSIPDLIHAITQ